MPPAKTHKCFALGCSTQTTVRLLMCVTHWALVPDEQQRAFWRAKRLRSRGGRFEADYHNACVAARDAVRKALST